MREKLETIAGYVRWFSAIGNWVADLLLFKTFPEKSKFIPVRGGSVDNKNPNGTGNFPADGTNVGGGSEARDGRLQERSIPESEQPVRDEEAHEAGNEGKR